MYITVYNTLVTAVTMFIIRILLKICDFPMNYPVLFGKIESDISQQHERVKIANLNVEHLKHVLPSEKSWWIPWHITLYIDSVYCS